MKWLGKGLVVAAALAMLSLPYAAALAATGDAAPTGTTEAAAQEGTGQADDSTSNTWQDLQENAGLGLVLAPVAVLSWMIFKVLSLFLGIVGIIFNWVTVVVVFKFATYLGNSPGMLVAWGILRDFGNIALIFGFVYIGIRTILDIGHFNTGRSLAYLVVAAVLMNFSLFAAEAVIDTANVLSATLYEQSYDSNSCIGEPWLGCAINNGIAGQILTKLEITSAFGEDGNVLNGGLAYFANPLPHILKFVGLSLFVVFAAFVLLAGTIMLISRGVILAFLMVTSPIGFAGMAVPPLQKLSEQWWKKLIDQALFAPAFLLLLFVSLKMTDGLSQLAGSQGGLAKALFSTDVMNTGTLIIFVLIIGFMIGSLMLANKFGIYFSDFATSSAARMTFGAMGMLGRRTAGRYAFRKADDMRKSSFARTGMGRLMVGGLDWAAKGNYDISSTKAGKSLAGLSKLDLGKSQHGGYDHIVHEGTKKLVDYSKTLKKTDEEEAIEKSRDEMLKTGKEATQQAAKENKQLRESQVAKSEQKQETNRGQLEIAQEGLRDKRTQAQALERRSGRLGQQIQDIDSQIQVELARGNTNTATTLYQQQNTLVTEKTQVDTEKTTVDTDVAGTQERIAELREQNKAETDLIRKRRKLLSEEQEGYSTASRSFDESIERNKKDFKNVAAREFAENLRKTIDEDSPAGFVFRRTAAGGHNAEVYKHAAHEIEEQFSKSDFQKAMGELTSAVKSQGGTAHDDAKKAARRAEAAHDETAHNDHQDDHPH